VVFVLLALQSEVVLRRGVRQAADADKARLAAGGGQLHARLVLEVRHVLRVRGLSDNYRQRLILVEQKESRVRL
jgi:hypothetical protein